MGCGCGGKSFSNNIGATAQRASVQRTVTSQATVQGQTSGARVVQSKGVTLGTQPVRAPIQRPVV